MTIFDAGEEVIRRIEELMDFDESLNLVPKEIILGTAAWKVLRFFYMFNYSESLPEQFTFNDLPVTSLPSGSDPWHVDVRSVGMGAENSRKPPNHGSYRANPGNLRQNLA